MQQVARCIACGKEMPEYSLADIIRIEEEYRLMMTEQIEDAEFIICADCENKYHIN